MRESRTYGSVRGARDEIRVPTATEAPRVHHAARRRGCQWAIIIEASLPTCVVTALTLLGDSASRGKFMFSTSRVITI